VATLFVLLFLGSLTFLALGLISPRLLARVIQKKLSRKQIGVIFGVATILSMFFVGYFAPAAKDGIKEGQKAAVVSPKLQSKVDSAVALPAPKQNKSPREVLLGISKQQLPKSEPVFMEEDGGWSIAVINERDTDFMMFSGAKQVARDYIFAMYASKLPIRHVAISSNYYAGAKYYRAALGSDVAKTQSDSTWVGNSVGPTIFYDFLKSHTNGSAGDGKYSTYVETNLE
jgi:hypothetical protein